MLSHPLLFSLCWPLAKEHTRRNRQSRTFLVENVIGEIWSELEEGSVLECPLPLLDFVGVCVCVRVCVCVLAKMHSYLFFLHFWKMFQIGFTDLLAQGELFLEL